MKSKKTRKPFYIYTVTAMSFNYEKGERDRDRDRTWGYFRDFKDAEKCIKSNCLDNFFEAGWYNMALIEKVQEGPMNFCHERWFYKLVLPKNAEGMKYSTLCRKLKYVKIDDPKCFERIVNFSMGWYESNCSW